MVSTTDGAGHTTLFAYDATGNLTRRTDPLGQVTTFTYDANGNRLTETTTRTNESGQQVTVTTTNMYDNKNRLLQTIAPNGGVIAIAYDELGKQAAVTDANGHRTAFSYDARGNRVQTIFPDGTTERTTYDAQGQRASATDRNGSVTTFAYDAAGRLSQTTYPGGVTTSNIYDAAGRSVAWTDPKGNVTTFAYNAAGNLVRQTDPLGNSTAYTYDARGLQLSMTDAYGDTTSFAYDALGRRTRTTFPDGTSTRTAYDTLGRRSMVTDQAGLTTQFDYLGPYPEVTRVIDALGHETVFVYDETRNRVRQVDANGHTTTWVYDALGRVVKQILPLGMFETFTYDSNGKVTSRTDFKGQTITFEYDVNDRLSRKRFPDNTQVTYTYTPTGQVQTVVDARGVTSFAYKAVVVTQPPQSGAGVAYRPATVINPDGTSLAYTYDVTGNRTALHAPSGVTSYTYDALNRLSRVLDPEGGLTTYTYDSVGNRASVTYPNNTRTQYTYDSLNRLVRLENVRSDGSELSRYDYTLGPAGHRVRVVESTGRTVDYVYDDLYRLVQEESTDTVLGHQLVSYTYDAVGNRVTMADTSGVTTYTYDANDRLLREGSITYAYDENGNTVRQVDGVHTTTYAYDCDNRLAVVQTPSSVINHVYDADGTRVHSTVNGNSTHYLVDKNRSFAQVLEERDGSGGLLTHYIYGDNLISQQRGGNTSYYHYDGLGSTRILTDHSEVDTDAYTYDAFGALLEATGSSENRYRFRGEQLDLDTDLYYLRARYYDPQIGRFLTTDPFEGQAFDPPTLHKYLYTQNDPVNKLDPSGEFTLQELNAANVIVAYSASFAIGGRTHLSLNYNVYLDFSLMKLHNRANEPFVRYWVEDMVREDFLPYAVDVTAWPLPSYKMDKHVYLSGSANSWKNIDLRDRLGRTPSWDDAGWTPAICGDTAYVFVDVINDFTITQGGAPLDVPIRIGNTTSHELAHTFGLPDNYAINREYIMDIQDYKQQASNLTWSLDSKLQLEKSPGTRFGWGRPCQP